MKTGRFLTLLLALIITAAMVFAIPAVVSSAAVGYVMEVHHNGAETPTSYDDFVTGWNAATTQKEAQPQSSFLRTGLLSMAASVPAAASMAARFTSPKIQQSRLTLTDIPLTEGCHLP